MRKTLLLVSLAAAHLAYAQHPFTVVEATIADMRTAMEQGHVTSRELVTQYLTRIAFYEDKLHAAITVNRNAIEEAAERDRERAQGRFAVPSTASRSRSRTTSKPPIC